MGNLKIKVCGMRNRQNIEQLLQLNPDFVGFIFYPPSARYVGDDFDPTIPAMITNAKRVGVFVNASVNDVLSKAKQFGLHVVQLHGNESADTCRLIKKSEVEVIKAFRVDETFDFSALKPFEDSVDYFLFDTKTSLYGGSGQKFDWSVLSKYESSKPLFLSGGIGADDAIEIKKMSHPNLFALDLNSKFEVEPALKDITLLSGFLKGLDK